MLTTDHCARPKTHIAQASWSDISELARLDAEVFANDSYTELVWRQVLDLAGPLAAVATADQTPGIIGFAAIALTWQHRDGWLMGIAVDPQFRRRGLGTALAHHVVHRASQHGVVTVRLTVDPENPAVSLYQRLGFGLESADPNYFGKGVERLVMSLDVTSWRPGGHQY